jgi:hypothetical protein
MRTKKHIEVLLENGIHFNTISKMNKGQIRVLAEKFETKEGVTTTITTEKITKVDPATAKKEMIPVKDGVAGLDAQGNLVVKADKQESAEMTEEELDEKFESKAQQKLFFAKCGNGKTKEQKKWCKLRDEYARSTTKKDYKKMPEKLHPEKTVKYKKKRTDENYEKYLENRIFEMIEKHIEPSMTKGELLKTIQEKVSKSENMILKNPPKNTMFSKDEGKEMKMKLPIGKLSSMSGEMKENTKEKERTKERETTKTPGRRNPHKDPAPGVKEKPKAEVKENTKEKEAPTKPGIKTPGRRRNPHKDPAPGVKEKPKAENEKQKSDFMGAIMQVLNTK